MNGDVSPHQGVGGMPGPAAHVVTANFEGETVLYDSIRCCPILLNVSAASVWAALDGRRSLADVVSAVAAGFGVASALVEADVVATVQRFQDLELLAVADHGE